MPKNVRLFDQGARFITAPSKRGKRATSSAEDIQAALLNDSPPHAIQASIDLFDDISKDEALLLFEHELPIYQTIDSQACQNDAEFPIAANTDINLTILLESVHENKGKE